MYNQLNLFLVAESQRVLANYSAQAAIYLKQYETGVMSFEEYQQRLLIVNGLLDAYERDYASVLAVSSQESYVLDFEDYLFEDGAGLDVQVSRSSSDEQFLFTASVSDEVFAVADKSSFDLDQGDVARLAAVVPGLEVAGVDDSDVVFDADLPGTAATSSVAVVDLADDVSRGSRDGSRVDDVNGLLEPVSLSLDHTSDDPIVQALRDLGDQFVRAGVVTDACVVEGPVRRSSLVPAGSVGRFDYEPGAAMQFSMGVAGSSTRRPVPIEVVAITYKVFGRLDGLHARSVGFRKSRGLFTRGA
jgi:hypothetical protein